MNHIHLQECESTQDELMSRMDTLKSHLLVTTKNQTSGRGRRGNSWTFYPGSLAFSFSLRPRKFIPLTCLEIGILLCESLGGRVRLKWPNDLMFNNQKCGGILSQSIGGWVAVGIGINICHDWVIKERGRGSLISLISLEASEDVQKMWPRCFYEFVLSHRITDDQSIIQKFGNCCDHIDRAVSTEKGDIKGIFRGVGNSGQALIFDGQKEHGIVNESLFYD